MKKGIHPDYHNITVQLTNGETFMTRATWGKEGAVLVLDIDIHTHPAWTGSNKTIETKGKISRFNNKFKGLNLS